MFCSNCGASNIDGAGFCSSCGAPLAPAAQGGVQQGGVPPTYTLPANRPNGPMYGPPKKKKTGLIVGIISGVVVVIAAVVILVVFVFGGGDKNSSSSSGGTVSSSSDSSSSISSSSSEAPVSVHSLDGYWETDPTSSAYEAQGVYFDNNGTCTFVYPEGGGLSEWVFYYTTSGDELTISDHNGEKTGTYSIDGNRLYIDLFDFPVEYIYSAPNMDNAFGGMSSGPVGSQILQPPLSPLYVLIPDNWEITYLYDDEADASSGDVYISIYHYSAEYYVNNLATDIEYVKEDYTDFGDAIFETIGDVEIAYFPYFIAGEQMDIYGFSCVAIDPSGNELTIDTYIRSASQPSSAQRDELIAIIRTVAY